MNFKSVLFQLLIVCQFFSAKAQEELGILPYRAEQYSKSLSSNNYGSRAAGDSSITYLLNTLELPIIDDFSKNRIKHFPTSVDHPTVFDSTSYRFLANNLPVDSVEFMNDSVFNYIVDPFTGDLDSTLAEPLNIVFFDTGEVFFRVDSFLAYPTFSNYIQNGITRTIKYEPDSVLYNKKASNFFAKDDSYSYWVAPGPFINYTMAIDQPTLGVLTFDGLDSLGNPYDNSSKLTYGISDFMTSKPINLFDYKAGNNRTKYVVNDSIYLSFFFQAEGNGDRPEREDSLILEFFDVRKATWQRVWGVEGDTSKEFERISIPIVDTNYMQNGFRFRFKNYATQSGNFDHWHLDYVRLIKDGGMNDEIKDFAIVNPIRSFLKDYTAMPWEHYKTDPKSFMVDTVYLDHINLSNKSDILKARYKVYKSNSVNYLYSSPEELRTSVTDKTRLSFEVKSSNRFQFPVDNEERQWFRCELETFSSDDRYSPNDTLIHNQFFDRFYSYDDKSAEKTYHLNIIGTRLAIKFNSPVRDTLKGVLINFVQTFEKIDNQKVNIIIYNTLGVDPIFQSGPIDVEKRAPGSFQRYNLPVDIIVEGDFYIGWEQLGREKTYVGYDINYNNQQNTFLSEIEGVWYNSGFSGTVMLRADFGDGTEEPLLEPEVEVKKVPFTLFPNPTNGLFSIEGISELSPVQLYNLQGSLVQTWTHSEGRTYDVSELQNGVYILIASDNTGTPISSKIIIAK